MLPRLRILVSAAGAPGTSTLIRQLLAVKERQVEVIACDADKRVKELGFALGCVASYTVPSADDEDYISIISQIIRTWKPNIFLPVSTYEVPVVAQYKEELEASGCKVLVSSPESIEFALNKDRLYQALAKFTPAIVEFNSLSTKYILKSKAAKGGRGMFYVTDDLGTRINAATRQKAADMQHINRDESYLLWSTGKFLACELLEGPHYDCMVLANQYGLYGEIPGVPLLVTCKTREQTRWGIITAGELIDSPRHVEICREVTRILGLSYNFGIQFIGDKVIDVNPRVSTFIYDEDFNEPYLAIKLALGEITPDEVRAYQDKVPIGRRFVRYMDQTHY